jgi:hypothetical protein
MTVILVLCLVGAITEVYLPLLFRERGRGGACERHALHPPLTPPTGGEETSSAFTQLELT